MSIVLDAVVILIFVLSIWCSYRRGFLRTLLSIISYLVSFFVAGFLGKLAANWIFDSFLKQPIQSNIVNLINQGMAQGGVDQAVADISRSIPDWLARIMLNGQSVSDSLTSVLAQNNIQAAADSITVQVVRPVVVLLLTVLVFVVLFLICRLLFRYLYRLTGVVNRLPVIGVLNGLLGAILGVVRAVIYLVLLGMLLWLVVLLTGNSLSWLNAEIIHDTNLFMLFYKLNPLVWGT